MKLGTSLHSALLKAAARIAAVALVASGVAHAQSWPSKPVRIVVPFSPGGTADLLARVVGQAMAQRTGQSFIVDAKPGASGAIGSLEVARAAADGYTLLLTTNTTHAIVPALGAQLKYNPVEDFTPPRTRSEI